MISGAAFAGAIQVQEVNKTSPAMAALANQVYFNGVIPI